MAEDSTQLRHLFEAAGYRVTERPGGWAAIRSRDRRSVVFSDEVRTPTDLEGAFAPDAIHRVLVYPESPGTVARTLAAERGIETFDTATIGSALGELLLLPVASATAAGPATGQARSRPLPQSSLRESAWSADVSLARMPSGLPLRPNSERRFASSRSSWPPTASELLPLTADAA